MMKRVTCLIMLSTLCVQLAATIDIAPPPRVKQVLQESAFRRNLDDRVRRFESQNFEQREIHLRRLSELVKANHEPVFEYASWVANTSSCLTLFSELVRVNYKPAFEAAIRAATKGIVRAYWSERSAGLKLLAELVRANYKPVFKIASIAAAHVILDEGTHGHGFYAYGQGVVHDSAKNLLSELFRANYRPAFEAATRAACRGIDHNQYIALWLFSELFRANYEPAFEAATRAVRKGIDDTNSLTSRNAHELKELIEQTREM